MGIQSSSKKDVIDYEKIDQMQSFNKFVKKKNTLLFSIAGAFLTFYIMLPALAFTTVLQQKAIGSITWVWVYSATLFVMTIILCTVYVKMASKFDRQAAIILDEYYKAGA